MPTPIMPPDEALWGEINAQTARIGWEELERHFARGSVIWVAPELDLVEVAAMLVLDRADGIESLMTSGELARATDEHARDWSDRDPELWAVVVAPWVLVQEHKGQPA